MNSLLPNASRPNCSLPLLSVVSSGIAFDSASNSGYQAAASSYSWSHTNAGNFLAVDVSLLSVPGSSVSGITYNGVSLTKLGSQYTATAIGGVECWGLVAPATGSHTIAVTLSGTLISSAEAVSYSNVDAADPIEAFTGAFATNVGAADATVTISPSTDGCWIHGAVATTDSSITAGQTSRNNVTGAGGSGGNEDSNAPLSPATPTATSWTGVGALATWAIAGYALRPSGDDSVIFDAPPGTLTVTGVNAVGDQGLRGGTAAFSISGFSATFARGFSAGTASVGVSGTVGTLDIGAQVGPGSYTLTTFDSLFSQVFKAGVAAISITGFDSSMIQDTVANVGPGSYSITTFDPLFAQVFNPVPGLVSVTGFPVSFIVNQGQGRTPWLILLRSGG